MDKISITVPATTAACDEAAEFFRRMGTIYDEVPEFTRTTEKTPQEIMDAGGPSGPDDQGGPGGPGGPDEQKDPPKPAVELGQVSKEDPTLVPWDKRIHSNAADKKFKGTDIWKPKRSVDAALVTAVVIELKAAITADSTGGPGASSVDGSDDTLDADADINFTKLMQDYTKHIEQGNITPEEMNTVVTDNGLKALPDLLQPAFSSFLSPVYLGLAAIWNLKSTQ